MKIFWFKVGNLHTMECDTVVESGAICCIDLTVSGQQVSFRSEGEKKEEGISDRLAVFLLPTFCKRGGRKEEGNGY